jgi:hypothetical protein
MSRYLSCMVEGCSVKIIDNSRPAVLNVSDVFRRRGAAGRRGLPRRCRPLRLDELEEQRSAQLGVAGLAPDPVDLLGEVAARDSRRGPVRGLQGVRENTTLGMSFIGAAYSLSDVGQTAAISS